MAECNVANVDVVGSSPITRSRMCYTKRMKKNGLPHIAPKLTGEEILKRLKISKAIPRKVKKLLGL